LGAVLVVEHVDVFCTVDLANPRQIGPIQLSELDYGLHLWGRRSVTTYEPAVPGSVNVTFNRSPSRGRLSHDKRSRRPATLSPFQSPTSTNGRSPGGPATSPWPA
jgi:hypothetical protein